MTAPRKAAIVFSGQSTFAPRCAIACGSRRVGSLSDERATAHCAVIQIEFSSHAVEAYFARLTFGDSR